MGESGRCSRVASGGEHLAPEAERQEKRTRLSSASSFKINSWHRQCVTGGQNSRQELLPPSLPSVVLEGAHLGSGATCALVEVCVSGSGVVSPTVVLRLV